MTWAAGNIPDPPLIPNGKPPKSGSGVPDECDITASRNDLAFEFLKVIISLESEYQFVSPEKAKNFNKVESEVNNAFKYADSFLLKAKQ